MKTISEIYSPKITTLNYGDFIYHEECGLCVIAKTGPELGCIICLWDGNRYDEPVKTGRGNSITKKDFIEMLKDEYLLDEFIYVSKQDAHKYITLRPVEPKDRT